jgi:hypothetical protein
MVTEATRGLRTRDEGTVVRLRAMQLNFILELHVYHDVGTRDVHRRIRTTTTSTNTMKAASASVRF